MTSPAGPWLPWFPLISRFIALYRDRPQRARGLRDTKEEISRLDSCCQRLVCILWLAFEEYHHEWHWDAVKPNG